MSLHGHAAVGERGHGRLGGEVDGVLVGVLAELGHVDPEDPDVVAGHRVPAPSVRPARSRSRWPRCRRRRCRWGRSASRTFMPSVTCSGSGSTLMMLPRTLVPSQSTTPATNGTGTPGAAKAHDGERPHLALGGDRDLRELGGRSSEAQALRRSKNRAPQAVHSLATRCGLVARAPGSRRRGSACSRRAVSRAHRRSRMDRRPGWIRGANRGTMAGC